MQVEGPRSVRTIARERNYPSLGQAICLLLGVTFLGLALAVPAGVLSVVVGLDIWGHPAAWSLLNIIALGAGVVWGARKRGERLREITESRPVSSRLILPGLMCLVASAVLLAEADSLVHLVVPLSEDTIKTAMDIFHGRVSLWGTLFARMIVAPITEELLFRGLILRGFLSRYSVWKAVLFSAVLFSLFHVDASKLISVLGGGILFGWWYVRTRSLTPCVVGHALHNGLPILMFEVIRPWVSDMEFDLTKVEFLPIWVTGVTVLVLAFGVWWFEQAVSRDGDVVDPEAVAVVEDPV
jgi:uncharacterized protein